MPLDFHLRIGVPGLAATKELRHGWWQGFDIHLAPRFRSKKYPKRCELYIFESIDC